MSKYKVQFQKGMSLQQFWSKFGTDGQCREALFLMRWPNGFRCTVCGHNRHCQLKSRPLMQVMRERDDTTPLSGAVQVDDAVWGGQRCGGKRGRGAAGKTPFVAAVACSNDGRPLRMRMTPIKGFSSQAIGKWARSHLAADSEVLSDGLYCFRAIAAVCPHYSITTGGGPASVEMPEFNRVNTMLGNVKNALRGIYHAVHSRHLGRYLGAFSWRFNRRFELDRMVCMGSVPYTTASLSARYNS
jgi:hypothetical protein